MIRIVLASILAFSLVGCGYPGHSLNALEKQADIEWIFGVFERNYAPADWKQAKWGVSLATAKADCMRGAEPLSNGDEFIAHLNSCVARFKDAHTSMTADGQVLPEMAQVAYLGFTTELIRIDANNFDDCKDKDGKDKDTAECKARREKDKGKEKKEPRIIYALRVKKLLPTTSATGFPLAEADNIVAVNGQPVDAYLLTALAGSADLGHTPATLNVLASLFAVRSSFTAQLPKEESITLTVLKSPKTIDVSLPWSRTDMAEFERLQNAAAKKQAEVKEPAKTASIWMGNDLIDQFFKFASDYRNGAGQRVNMMLNNTFRLFRFSPAVNFVENITAADGKAAEALPFDSAAAAAGQVVDVSKGSFKARVVLQEDGGRIGYIRISTFSLGDGDVKTFQELLSTFTKMKVKGIILDTLDNGGGSLVAGLRMSNALTTKDLQYPSMQFGLNDNWVNGFRGDAISAPSDATRTRAARISKMLKEDLGKGLRISRQISATELDIFELTGDKSNCLTGGKCLDPSVKLVLLVNEMCASMCDIFASTFSDNKLGTIIGSQTMGAGGNVVLHGISPVSQVMVSQTESLIVDVNGQYLENQGVKPTIEMDTILERSNKYSGVYGKAFEQFK